MRRLMMLSAAMLCGSGLAAEPEHLMSSADVSCATYLTLPEGEAINLDYWVAGRIVAIAPATFQRDLAKIPFSRMRADLRGFCQDASDATLFQASAILIFNYQRSSQKP